MKAHEFENARKIEQHKSSSIPQKLWFIDKETGKKAVVATEKLEGGKIFFSYQGRQYAFPVTMLGTRVYACLPETKTGKAQTAKELFYQGEFFRFDNGRWISHNGSIPKEKYQQRLSDIYQKRCKHYVHTVKELVTFARKQKKDSAGIHTAIRALEIAMMQATAGQANGFLATLCSLYRQTGASSAVISLYDYAVWKYGKSVETTPFLTSVSAAFMDAGDIEMAEILKNKVLTRGGNDAKLTSFTRRFDAETRLE